jgi:hypothetical protein
MTQPRGGFLRRTLRRAAFEFGLPFALQTVCAVAVQQLTFSTINHFELFINSKRR